MGYSTDTNCYRTDTILFLKMKTEQVKEGNDLIKGLYKKPFHYDDCGQMIFDADHNQVVDIRGWGRISKMDNPEAKQDAFGRFVCKLLNDNY